MSGLTFESDHVDDAWIISFPQEAVLYDCGTTVTPLAKHRNPKLTKEKSKNLPDVPAMVWS